MMELKELRETEGYTQRGLARLSGVNQATISKVEAGLTGNVTMDVVLRLAHALKVEPSTMFFMLAEVERNIAKGDE